MVKHMFTELPIVFSNTDGLARVLSFPDIFAGWLASDGLLAWYDFAHSASLTVVDNKVAAAAPRLGGIAALAQSDAAKRPALANGRAVFSAASSTFLTAPSGWPVASFTAAVIMRRAAQAPSIEVVISSFTASNQLAQIYFQANGELRTRITAPTTSAYEEPSSPIPANGTNFLVIGDYDPANDAARCRLNGGGAGTAFTASQDITMAAPWVLGANNPTTGGSFLNGEVADVLLFDTAKIGSDVAAVLLEYGQQFKAVA